MGQDDLAAAVPRENGVAGAAYDGRGAGVQRMNSVSLDVDGLIEQLLSVRGEFWARRGGKRAEGKEGGWRDPKDCCASRSNANQNDTKTGTVCSLGVVVLRHCKQDDRWPCDYFLD